MTRARASSQTLTQERQRRAGSGLEDGEGLVCIAGVDAGPERRAGPPQRVLVGVEDGAVRDRDEPAEFKDAGSNLDHERERAVLLSVVFSRRALPVAAAVDYLAHVHWPFPCPEKFFWILRVLIGLPDEARRRVKAEDQRPTGRGERPVGCPVIPRSERDVVVGIVVRTVVRTAVMFERRRGFDALQRRTPAGDGDRSATVVGLTLV